MKKRGPEQKGRAFCLCVVGKPGTTAPGTNSASAAPAYAFQAALMQALNREHLPHRNHADSALRMAANFRYSHTEQVAPVAV
jgi:hypothetical protein